MGSEQNNSTRSFTQSTEPKLCVNGCGFFGSPSNKNLCSKCYRSVCAEEAVVEKSFKLSPPRSPASNLEPEKAFLTAVRTVAEQALSPGEEAFIKATLEKSLKPSSPVVNLEPEKALLAAVKTVAEPALAREEEAFTKAAVDELSSAQEEAVTDENEPSKPARPNRCMSCNKKVGILGFKCKCGSMFCGEHRYPETHECFFDYKKIGRAKIAKANPLVKTDKIQRF